MGSNFFGGVDSSDSVFQCSIRFFFVSLLFSSQHLTHDTSPALIISTRQYSPAFTMSDLKMEIVRLVEEGERAAYTASVLKGIIESWSDADLTEIGVDRAAVESDLKLTSSIIPLSEDHASNERSKDFARTRLEDAWGADWEKKMGNWLPPWPSAIFLVMLAVYSKKYPWGEATVFFENQIAKRLAKPKTCKNRWLTSQDLVAINDLPLWKKKGKGKTIPVKDVAILTPADNPSSSSTTQEVIRATEPPTAGPSGSGSHPSSSVLPPPSGKPLPAAILEGPEVSTLAPKSVVHSGPSENPPSRKRKAIEAPPQQKKGNKWRTEIKIPVNLDIEDRIRTMRREAVEARDEQRLRDLKLVEKALRWIGHADGEERVGVEVLKRRMILIFEVLQIEIE